MRSTIAKSVSALLLLVSFSLSSCGQKDITPNRETTPELAPEAMHASMTATVNGKEWVSGGLPSNSSMEEVQGEVDPKTGYLTIIGRKYSYHALKPEDLEEIRFTIKNLQEGTYRLGPGFDSIQTGNFYKGLGSRENYFIQENQAGVVTITRIDTVAHKVFGAFSFSTKNNSAEQLTITDGSFDNVSYVTPQPIASETNNK